MSDSDVFLFGNSGEVLCSAPCSFGGVRVAPLKNDFAAVISDQKIEKIELE